jgi:hypothetical protein
VYGFVLVCTFIVGGLVERQSAGDLIGPVRKICPDFPKPSADILHHALTSVHMVKGGIGTVYMHPNFKM